MLSRPHRLHRSGDFSATVRGGARAGSRTLVAHVRLGDPADPLIPPRIGLIVSKAVGPAVVRNRVKRRLRHLSRPLLPDLPPDARVVLRALPASGAAEARELEVDLTAVVQRAVQKAHQVQRGRETAKTQKAGRTQESQELPRAVRA